MLTSGTFNCNSRTCQTLMPCDTPSQCRCQQHSGNTAISTWYMHALRDACLHLYPLPAQFTSCMCSAVCLRLSYPGPGCTPLLRYTAIYYTTLVHDPYVHAWSMPTNKHVAGARRYGQWLLASCMAISVLMPPACEGQSKMPAVGALGTPCIPRICIVCVAVCMLRAYLHAPVTACDELSACTTLALCQPHSFSMCKGGCTAFTAHRRHQHGSRATHPWRHVWHEAAIDNKTTPVIG
jgi:hypothetical protein